MQNSFLALHSSYVYTYTKEVTQTEINRDELIMPDAAEHRKNFVTWAMEKLSSVPTSRLNVNKWQTLIRFNQGPILTPAILSEHSRMYLKLENGFFKNNNIKAGDTISLTFGANNIVYMTKDNAAPFRAYNINIPASSAMSTTVLAAPIKEAPVPAANNTNTRRRSRAAMESAMESEGENDENEAPAPTKRRRLTSIFEQAAPAAPQRKPAKRTAVRARRPSRNNRTAVRPQEVDQTATVLMGLHDAVAPMAVETKPALQDLNPAPLAGRHGRKINMPARYR